jgi:hypothetical protein
MDNLLGAMQIIDRNSTKFAEGDYLEVCNLLKKAYDRRSDPVYFFNYDDFRILPVGSESSGIIFEYFYDHYFEKALQFDSDFIHRINRFNVFLKRSEKVSHDITLSCTAHT